jgi:branched-chain amino acid transport system substrate-binding protein
MAQAILGVKSAYEKAQKAGAASPNQEQIIAALENHTFEAPGGTVRMALGKGHQAVQSVAYGVVKNVGGELTLVDVKHYPPEQTTPPDGVKSEVWIKSGFKAK